MLSEAGSLLPLAPGPRTKEESQVWFRATSGRVSVEGTDPTQVSTPDDLALPWSVPLFFPRSN